MLPVIIALLLVWLLFHWGKQAYHQPHNLRFALRYELLRWFLLFVLLWLTVSVIQQRFFIPHSFFPPPPPRSDKQAGGTVAVCDGFRSGRVLDH